MKKFIVLLMALVATPAFASGSLTFQPKYTFGQSKVTPMVGLSVYERLGDSPVFTNVWAGIGSDTFSDHQQTWYVVKNTFEVHVFSVITFGIGGEVGLLDRDALNKGSEKSWRGAVFGKAAVKLW